MKLLRVRVHDDPPIYVLRLASADTAALLDSFGPGEVFVVDVPAIADMPMFPVGSIPATRTDVNVIIAKLNETIALLRSLFGAT